MSQALYRKWRPRLWDQVIAQDHVVRTLQNAIRSDRIGHAYLFAGPRGTGKTTTARLLAKAINCLDEDLSKRPCDACAHCQAINEGRFLDLIEIDAASNTSVEDVRDLRDKINFSPTQGRKKVYLIDEVHMLSTAAFNALLKTLEEPPDHAIFILATTEVHKIPATVLSRCQRHEFRRIPVADTVGLLKNLCQQEKLDVDEDALILIARQSTGSMRDAISLLDQLSSTGEHVSLQTAQKVLGTATNQLVVELVESILARQAGAGLTCIHHALDSGSDPRQFARQMVDYLRGLMMFLLGNGDQVEATPEIRQQMQRHAAGFDLGRLRETIRLFNGAATDTRSGWQPGLPLELALAEAIEPASPPVFAPQPAAQAVYVPHVSQAPAAYQPPAATQPPPPVQAAAPAVPPAVEAPIRTKPAASEPAPAPVRTGPPPAETAQAAPQASPEPQPGQPRFGFQELLTNWPRIRAIVKKQRVQTEGLMNSCRPLAIKDGSLVLGFQNDLLKKKMETGDNLAVIRQSIQVIMGSELPVVCAVMANKASGGASDLDFEGDGIVGTALNLGGKIVRKE